MTLAFIPASAPTLLELCASLNAALALIPTRALEGFGIGSLDQTRILGRDYRAMVSHDAGTGILATPYEVIGFEGQTTADVAAQLAAFVAAHPAAFISPAFPVGLPAGRFEPQSSAVVFWTPDQANGLKNWDISGANAGGGAGDHDTLVNRTLVSQHPARSVDYDAVTSALDAATTVIDSIVLTPAVGAACFWELYAFENLNANAESLLGRFAAMVGPNGLLPVDNLIIQCAKGTGLAGAAFAADVAGGSLRLTVTLAGIAAGVSVYWRRINMTPPV